MSRLRMVLVYGTAAVVLALDQLTKWAVVENLRGEPPVDVIGSFVQLTYTTNTGGAFSILDGFPMFFGIMAMVIIVMIAVWARRLTGRPTLLVLGLLLGGAIGNFIDRLLRGDQLLRGGVVDFVDIGTFPVFNVADSCITVGAILLALLVTWEDVKARKEHPDTVDGDDHGSDHTPASEPATTDAQPPVASEADPDPQR